MRIEPAQPITYLLELTEHEAVELMRHIGAFSQRDHENAGIDSAVFRAMYATLADAFPYREQDVTYKCHACYDDERADK
jgi:hypothetical protein